VLGSLDLEKAIQSGERRFEPGLLARANRGILYIDEVNLLGDHLVDILLDAAAMGQNYVEREGISFSHPASFMMIGTMNPEEGDLRPQLLDRFALAVEVEGLRDPAERAEAVRRRMAFEADPAAFVRVQQAAEQAERERITRARALLPAVEVSEAMLDLIVRICAAFDVDGLRADLAIYRTATALAAYAGRTAVEAADGRAAVNVQAVLEGEGLGSEQPGGDAAQRLVGREGSVDASLARQAGALRGLDDQRRQPLAPSGVRIPREGSQATRTVDRRRLHTAGGTSMVVHEARRRRHRALYRTAHAGRPRRQGRAATAPCNCSRPESPRNSCPFP